MLASTTILLDLEAAVVSYLRYLHEPVRQRFYPGRLAGELFPQLTPEQAAIAGPLRAQSAHHRSGAGGRHYWDAGRSGHGRLHGSETMGRRIRHRIRGLGQYVL